MRWIFQNQLPTPKYNLFKYPEINLRHLEQSERSLRITYFISKQLFLVFNTTFYVLFKSVLLDCLKLLFLNLYSGNGLHPDTLKVRSGQSCCVHLKFRT